MVRHIVLSYSRTTQLKDIVGLLVESFPDDEILVADSGQRGDGLREILGDLIHDVEHIETGASDAGENMRAMASHVVGPTVFYHDDDLFYPEKLKLSLEMASKNNADLMFSMKFDYDSFNLRLNSFSRIEAKDILMSYLIDPYGNCPLITGIFFNGGQVFNQVMDFKDDYGKYSDVQLFCLAAKGVAKIQIGAYMKYSDHEENDNKIRDLQGRDGLSSALRMYDDYELFVLSFLIYHGYPNRIFHYFFGLLLLPTVKRIRRCYLKKLAIRFSKKFS